MGSLIRRPPDPSYSSVMSAPSLTQPLNEAQLEDEAQAMEDELLRNDGYPQQSIYSLRAAGLDYLSIRTLPKPAPSTSAGAPLADEYWMDLRDRGVPPAALSTRFQDAPRISASEADLRSYFSLVSGFSPRPTPASASSGAHLYIYRFGSPVRVCPLTDKSPLQPGTPSGAPPPGTPTGDPIHGIPLITDIHQYWR